MRSAVVMALSVSLAVGANQARAQDSHAGDRKPSDGGIEVVGVVDALLTMGKMVRQARDIDTEMRGHPYDPRVDGEFTTDYAPEMVETAKAGQLVSAPFHDYAPGVSRQDDKYVRNCRVVSRFENPDIEIYPETVALVAGRPTITGTVRGDFRYQRFSCAIRGAAVELNYQEE